jgi:hypothetical protein
MIPIILEGRSAPFPLKEGRSKPDDALESSIVQVLVASCVGGIIGTDCLSPSGESDLPLHSAICLPWQNRLASPRFV